MHQRPSARHYLLLGGLAFAWGSAFLFVKVGLAPIMVTLARTAVATGLLYAASCRQGHNLPSPIGND